MAAGTCRVRPVLKAIFVSLIVGGCLTKSAMKIGSAQEVPTGYREVQLAGTTVQVQYTTMRRVSGSHLTADDTLDRWTSISLDSLRWLTLDRVEVAPPRYYVPRDCSETRSASEPAPTMMLHEYQRPFS